MPTQKTKKEYTVVSLFDGVSCARVACKKAGVTVKRYFASEIDPFALQTAYKNFPDTFPLGDIKEISAAKGHIYYGCKCDNNKHWHRTDDVDLLVGGSPCQDLSIAKNNRKGLSGERSGLFYEYVRLLKEIKPKYFILENVASMPKQAMEDMSAELFGIQPVMLNAALVSAQTRKRLFWVGKWDTPECKYVQVDIPQPKDKGIFLKDILEPKVPEGYYVKLKANTLRVSGRGSKPGSGHDWDLIRVAHIGKGGQADRIYSPEGKSTTLSANGVGGGAKTGLYAVPVALRNRGNGKQPEFNGTGKANAMTTVQTDSMVAIIQRGRGKNKGGVHTEKSPTVTSSAFEHNNHLYEKERYRRLTPMECERLQCLPDGYTGGASDTQRYKMLGNAFNVDIVAHIIKNLK